MTEKNFQMEHMVFGLDIGTRSIVGTVGYKDGDRFIVVVQRSKEHDTRAMLDGQIHDISKVAETIRLVKEECEEAIGLTLKQACIAAAGRVLRTLNTHVDMVFGEERETKSEDISNLMSLGIDKAYREFAQNEESDIKFYCVGYSVVKYYLNKYPIGKLLGHKAKQISADMIATFLPDDVVDGLYKAVELAGLEVANLTLEPIAAISVAIPEKFRMLNIALVDVGAGTSDISITREGSIIAYGMIPIAGDTLTDEIANHCLVDFEMAEHIKRESNTKENIAFTDIMGLEQTVSAEQVQEILHSHIEEMATKVADTIIELNGGKAVSAVFVVGGGGMIKGYTDNLANKLGIMKERVALRGGEVMQNIDFMEEDVERTSLLVTPIGICKNYYENSNNLIYVTFNGKRMKMYDNGKVAVVDVAMQAEFANDGLFPKRGKALTYSVNGKSKIVKGEIGEAAVITVNDEPADISTLIKLNDKVVIKESTSGVRARIRVEQLFEYKQNLDLVINSKRMSIPRTVYANGKEITPEYEIMEDDRIELPDYCFRKDIIKYLELAENTAIKVNNALADDELRIYSNFTVVIEENQEDKETESKSETKEFTKDKHSNKIDEVSKETSSNNNSDLTKTIRVKVNNDWVILSDKNEYVYVDIFDHIDFDLANPKGKSVITRHNGETAQYMNPLNDGDVLEIYWKD